MNYQESVNKLIGISQKPFSGFKGKSESNKITIKVKPKTLLFGCLILFFITLS